MRRGRGISFGSMLRSLAGKLRSDIVTGPIGYVGRRVKLGPLGLAERGPVQRQDARRGGRDPARCARTSWR